MTSVLPRDRAEQIIAEYSAGKRIYEIVAEYGHSPQTVRKYALGRSAPGQYTPREDAFAPFAGYCRRRLDDDPHLRAMPLLAEITALGFPRTTDKALYRALKRHAIRVHPCPDCRIARINGYALRPPEHSPRPFPLAIPLAPAGGETLASFLGRLAGANHVAPAPCSARSTRGSASGASGTTTAGSTTSSPPGQARQQNSSPSPADRPPPR